MNACTRWLLGTSLVALVASSFAAPLPAQASNPKPGATQAETSDSVVWTGRAKGADGSLVDEPMRSARELRKSLAEIQVSIDVDRQFEPALVKLGELQVMASRNGYPERQEVLIEIALARSATFEALGKLEAALDAATEVFPRVRSADARFLFKSKSDEDRAMSIAAAADPRLVALRARLEKDLAQKPADGDDRIENIVNEALRNNPQGGSVVIKDLGDRALPALEKLAAKDFDSLPPIGADPLYIIADINQGRAAEFVRVNFDRGGSIWKARVLRVLKQNQALRWGVVNNRPELEYPEWLPVLERLLDEPTTVREAFGHLKGLVERDALTVGMQQRAIKILNGDDTAAAASAMDALGSQGRPSAKPIYEAVLASPSGEVRAFAAKQLARYETSDALQAAASSADPNVREQTAVALGARQCARLSPARGAESYYFAPSSLSAVQRGTLARLVADADAEVRVAAANSIVTLSTPLDDTVYERIGKDPDSRVRATLLRANAVPVPVQAKIALALAADTDLGVLQSFDTFAVNVLGQSDEPMEPAFLPAIEARLRNPTLPFKLDYRDEQKLYARTVKTPEGLAAIVRWTLELRGSLAGYAAKNIEDRIGNRSSTLNQPWPRGTVSAAAVGIRLTPQELAAFFALTSLDGDWVERQLAPSLILLSDDLAPAFLPIARDAKREKKLRLAALDVAARGDPAQVSDCLLELMADSGWQSSNVKQLSAHAASIGNAMQAQGAARTFEMLFDKSKKFDPILASSFAFGYAKAHPLDDRSADRILAAWFDNKDVGPGSLEAALKQVASRPREAQGDWLIRALHDNRFWESALNMLGDLRDPSYLGLLQEGLSKGYGAPNNPERQNAALNALTRYFSEPAAEIILKVAGSTGNSDLREKCFKALDTIRQYKEEKGRWDDDRVSKEATATAVRDLLVLLEDKEPAVRAQAVRGLGTLRAVEQLPRVVRMLKDGDAEVRKAADEALKVLNSPPEKKD